MAGGDPVPGGDLDELFVEHDVGQDRTDDAPERLSDGVGGRVPGTDAGPGPSPQQPICGRHNRIEVRAGHWATQQDECGQAERGSGGVLEELQPDIARRELLSRNARANDHSDEHSGSGRLGQQPSG